MTRLFFFPITQMLYLRSVLTLTLILAMPMMDQHPPTLSLITPCYLKSQAWRDLNHHFSR